MENLTHATPTKVEFRNDWESQRGTMYDFWVEFDNGDKGVYTSKSRDQKHVVEGVARHYEKQQKDGQNGPWFKIIPKKAPHTQERSEAPLPPAQKGKTAQRGNDEIERRIVRQSSLNRAVELAVADKIPVNIIMPIARYFEEWVNGKSKAVDLNRVIAWAQGGDQAAKSAQPETPKENPPAPINEADDGQILPPGGIEELPF